MKVVVSPVVQFVAPVVVPPTPKGGITAEDGFGEPFIGAPSGQVQSVLAALIARRRHSAAQPRRHYS